MKQLISGAVVVVVALAACSGGTSSTVGDGAPVVTVNGGDEASDAPANVKTYFDSFHSDLPNVAQKAVDVSQPESLAATYAERFVAKATATKAIGGFTADQKTEVEYGNDSVTTCQTIGGSTQALEDQGMNPCTTYSDIKTDSDGLLQSFKIDDIDLAPRLHGPGASVTDAGVTADVLYAYRSVQSDTLEVGLKITNTTDSPVRLNTFGVTYVDPNGQQGSASGSTGPPELLPGASANYTIGYSAPLDVGGILHLTGSADDFATQLEFNLQT